ncbi:Hydrolase or acyltransferase of alpha/beta superfamily protein [Halomicronema hongdechloris C2206]|uniref:Hydrolase or acyltransferase of alpha/beta superfamily protein n=1 Tax=Halomicronema hongdechloris C2206 TaxID=1641165 RepID=A0A1Z3HQ25_9CYAN|nr:alpha/beta hydrolase [Halomicronema hongdechloris]ASC72414.1 Hydrolase or acyltransferase of alpha/beta superfamily protein [Halomicronema hongdechloris C2206]
MFPEFLPPAVHQLSEATSIEMAQQMQRQDVITPLSPDPIATAYVCQGAGEPPLLLLHGFDSSLLEFRRLLPRLAARTQVWAIDLLGFGFSDRIVSPRFDPAAIQQHLHSAWQQLIGRPVILVAASMGGAAALEFALAYPDCVEQLVLIDSAGLSAGPAIDKVMVPPLDGWATAFLQNAWVRHRISLRAYCDRTLVTPDADCCTSLHVAMPGWKQALIAFTKSGGYRSLQAKLPQITCPTLILWGEQDRILGTKDATRFQQAIPHSQLVWIADCGHVPHLERPEATASAILQHLPMSPRAEQWGRTEENRKESTRLAQSDEPDRES